MDSATKIAELKKQIAELTRQLEHEERNAKRQTALGERRAIVETIISEVLKGFKYEFAMDSDDTHRPNMRILVKAHIRDKCKSYDDMVYAKEREIKASLNDCDILGDIDPRIVEFKQRYGSSIELGSVFCRVEYQ